MCGRYALYTETEQWTESGMGWPGEEGFAWRPSYNVAPGTMAPVVVDRGGPVIAMHRWGLVPSWAREPAIGNRMINARAETLTEKPAFRAAARRRRCLVPANGFYEWQKSGKGKIPHYIHPRSGRLLAFAGLWESWSDPAGEPLNSFTIVTVEPNRLLAPIHDRMPAILAPEQYERWLDPRPMDGEQLRSLLSPLPDPELEAYPVSTLVNRPGNDSDRCIAPI